MNDPTITSLLTHAAAIVLGAMFARLWDGPRR